MICEKCGTAMNEIGSSYTTGMKCPNCGWGWVTTNIEPIAEDNTDYEIWLEPGNAQDISIVKLIADISGVNFIQAKKILNSENIELIYKATNEAAAIMAKAQRVQAVARRLKSSEVRFTISPDFPYEI